MALEASDLNDGGILKASVRETGKDGLMRYKCRLPSGRDLTSEWMREEHFSKAAIAWCDAVRNQAVADVQFDARERAAAAKRALQPVTTDTGSQIVYGTQPDTPPRTNPLDFAKAQVEAARAAVDGWRAKLCEAQVEYDAAARMLCDWTKIVTSLESPDTCGGQ